LLSKIKKAGESLPGAIFLNDDSLIGIMINKIKARIHEIIEKAPEGDILSRIFDIFILSLIVLNVTAVILETVDILYLKYSTFFVNFELFSVAVFSVEYILRLWTCNFDKRFRQPISGRIRFALTPLAIIDLLAVLPFYLASIFTVDLRFIRVLRMFRILRILKAARYSESIRNIVMVVIRKKEELLMSLFILLIVLIVSSSLVYFVENSAQPEAFSSIPASMWWGIVTLTTIGYGDMYPITPLGRFLGGIIAILGIGMVALPAAVIVSGYFEQKKEPRKCPHCGKIIEK